ncbi:hypothetical protein C8R44DRAFT_882503 [Mycena epipterygia]|nr:hypothetical protein C8R44DRAFT_882503 [Mycena epipterygia]
MTQSYKLSDQILDLISPETLPSCSIVCRSFVVHVQSHLWGAIYIDNRRLASRFSSTLSYLPYLILRARSLTIVGCGVDILGILAPIAWSHVDTLALDIGWTQVPGDSFLTSTEYTVLWDSHPFAISAS